MDPEITSKVLDNELTQLADLISEQPAEIIGRGEDPPSLRLRLRSEKDGEDYYLRGEFDDYPRQPPLWEFYDPDESEVDKPQHYPKDEARDGISTIFLDDPVICHPANRGAYAGYTGKHDEWEKANWQEIKGDSVDSIPAFVDMVLARLNSGLYKGRMSS